MGLVTCPDCNAQVSDSAGKCPACGRDMNTAGFGCLLSVVGIIVTVVGIVLMRQGMEGSGWVFSLGLFLIPLGALFEQASRKS